MAPQHLSKGQPARTTGAVDAENSFGAMLRSDFRCEIADGLTTWNLVSLARLN